MNMENNQQYQPQQVQWPPVSERKSVFAIGKGDTAFAVCAVLACIMTAIFGIFGGFALGYTVASVCMLVLFMVYFSKQGKASFFSVLCGALALAIAAVFLCTTNSSVRFFGVLVGFGLSLACLDGLTAGRTRGNRQTVCLFFKAVATVKNIGVSIRSLFSDRRGNKKTVGKVLVGLLCAVPVLIVVIPLLRASDEAFRGMMDRMFEDAGATLFKANFGLGMSVFAVTYGFSLKKGHILQEREHKFSGIENVYLVSFLSAISLCYLLYLFSQLAYFFSAFKGFLPTGEITYAQYARKGFFEMCVIAVINFVLVSIAMLLAKKQNGKVCLSIKLLATFIGVFTLVIIATAISKMVLYINEYGMTVRRVTTSAFMIFLAVVFISIILRIYIRKINIVKTALLTAGCVVLLLGTVNVNRVCAQYNYESYIAGKHQAVDVAALYNLGDEGIPYVVKLADDKNASVKKQAKQYLAEAYLYDYFVFEDTPKSFTVADLQKVEAGSEFSQFSLPRAEAYDSLYMYLEKYPQFSSQCHKHLMDLHADFD